MNKEKKVKIRRKGKTVEIAWWIYDYCQRKKRERKKRRLPIDNKTVTSTIKK